MLIHDDFFCKAVLEMYNLGGGQPLRVHIYVQEGFGR